MTLAPTPLSAAELEEAWLKIQALSRAITEDEVEKLFGCETADRLKLKAEIEEAA